MLQQISVQYSGSVNLYTINKETGAFVNETYFDKHKVLGHLSSSGLTLGGTISSETFKKKSSDDNAQTANNQNASNKKSIQSLKGQSDFGNDNGNDLSVPDRNEEQAGEFSFNVPWSLNLNYSLRYNSRYNTTLQEFEPEYTQTINLRGNLSLTPKWKIGGNMNYDIQARKTTLISMNLYRDLHCWEMSLSIVPFGTYKSFNFRINIKSSIFKDVEFKRQDSWRDNVDF